MHFRIAFFFFAVSDRDCRKFRCGVPDDREGGGFVSAEIRRDGSNRYAEYHVVDHGRDKRSPCGPDCSRRWPHRRFLPGTSIVTISSITIIFVVIFARGGGVGTTISVAICILSYATIIFSMTGKIYNIALVRGIRNSNLYYFLKRHKFYSFAWLSIITGIFQERTICINVDTYPMLHRRTYFQE